MGIFKIRRIKICFKSYLACVVWNSDLKTDSIGPNELDLRVLMEEYRVGGHGFKMWV